MSARVLVVDDIAANVRLLEAKLLVEYYDVITATDGPTALELVRERLPDIILLDVMMPGMDGFEVCRRIKSDPETAFVPVIMVTALSEVSDRVQGLQAGADDFLTKPVNDVALFARIRSLVRLKRASDEWRTREATALQFGVADGDAKSPDPAETGEILLMMDDSGVPTSVLNNLQAHGHSVSTARDCNETLSLALAKSYDLILANDRFAGEDTLRLCSQLRSDERTRSVPILLMIQEGDNDRLAKALELGVSDYLIKPVEREELLARTRTQVRRKRYEDSLRRNYENSLNAALTDSLTGLNNRRYLEAHYEAVDSMLADADKPMSVLILDIDRFKQINDNYGHQAGDEVLKGVADRILINLRGFDTAVRLGGEEFVVLMPNTLAGAAAATAERLCEAVKETPFKVSHTVGEIPLTVSIGVTTEVAGRCTLEQFLKRADEALYQAKRGGRDKVVIARKRAAPEDSGTERAGAG